jgi:hypothetical protein
MMQIDFNYINRINDYLTANAATIFSKQWLPVLTAKKLNFKLPTMILAPNDVALRKLSDDTNRTPEEIVVLSEGQDILGNHISLVPTKKTWPMFTAMNGKEYGRGPEDFNVLQPTSSTTILGYGGQNITVIIISRVIIHDDQLSRLKKSRLGYSVWNRVNSGSIQVSKASQLQGHEIPAMGRDLFRFMVTEQNLRGRDLLALCTGNQEITKLCDRDKQIIFRDLLKREFNFDYSRSVAKESPRELYAKFHNFRLEVYIPPNYPAGSIQIGYRFVIRDNESTEEKVALYLQSGSKVITVPVEGWFADNFSKPDDVDQYNSSLRRQQVYLIYIRDNPEIATLFRRAPVQAENQDNFLMSNNWISDYFGDQRFKTEHNDILNIYTLMKRFLNRFGSYQVISLRTTTGNVDVVFINLSEDYELKR